MKKIIIIGAVLLVIGGVIWFTKGGSMGDAVKSDEQKYADASDAVGDFYHQWLLAAQDPAAKPNKVDLAKASVLSSDLSAVITTALKSGSSTDPVLCQSVVPKEITQRHVFDQADKVQMLITSKDKTVTNQALVTLNKINDSWLITKIDCSNGEVAPVKEFSFEEEGFLIKASIPKPFNNKNWHIVFEEDGKAGNAVPIFFDAKSQCTSLEGIKAICKPDQLKETDHVRVYGQMTERGAIVVRLEFVK